MSIADEITRIQTAKANIKTAINNKGGNLTNETISSYATAINNLPSGDLTIEGQQVITGILTGTVDEFDTVYSKILSGGSNWNTDHNKLSNPADLPTGGGSDVAFSSDGEYLAVAHDAYPYLTVYKRSGDTFNKLTIPEPINNVDYYVEEEGGGYYIRGYGSDVAFSSDDTYLAVTYEAYPYLTVYKRSGDTFNKLTIAAPMDDVDFYDEEWGEYVRGSAKCVSFSSDDTYLAVAPDEPPYLTVYKRSGDEFTKLEGIEALPNFVYGVSFSNDDTYLAVAHRDSPFLTIYKRSVDTFTKLSNPEDLPAGIGWDVSFSNDGTYLAVGHNTSPFLTIYKRSGDAFNKLSNPTDLPAGDGKSVSFSNDNNYLAAGHGTSYGTSQYLTVYKRSGDTFNKITGIEALPGDNWSSGTGVSFSNDGIYLAVAHDKSPYLTVYKTSLINPINLISPALNAIPLEYDDLGYALESGVENDEIDMVSIFRGTPVAT